jgi:hypothetical protein
MRRIVSIVVVVIAVAALTATAAIAASPHFKKGGTPVCNVSAGTTSKSTTCSASLAGLGGEDLLITVTTSGSAVYQCQNAGGNTAPGQNRVLVGPVTAPTTISGDEIKNGNLTFTTNPAVLTADDTVSGAAAGCPNANWTGVSPVLTLTDIALRIEQPVGTVLFTCTASNSGGLSGRVPLSC